MYRDTAESERALKKEDTHTKAGTEYLYRDYLTSGTPTSALKYKRLVATGMKPEDSNQEENKVLYQNPFTAQYKRDGKIFRCI